jgi:hypothetical protein
MHRKSVSTMHLTVKGDWNKRKNEQKNLKLSYSEHPASQTLHDIQRPWKEVSWVVQKTVELTPFFLLLPSP